MLNQIAAIHGTGVAASTNSYESIATVTIGSGGAATAVFSSIPSTYKHLQIRAIGRVTGAVTDSNFVAYFNTDTTSGNYPQHTLYGTGTAAAAGYTASDSNLAIGRCPGGSSSANMFGLGICDILDYADTNKFKTTRSLAAQDQNGSGIVLFNSGLWRSTAAINQITIAAQAGNGNLAQYSQFALYGIKG